MMLLINIDVNYVLPYVVPIYNNDTDRKTTLYPEDDAAQWFLLPWGSGFRDGW